MVVQHLVYFGVQRHNDVQTIVNGCDFFECPICGPFHFIIIFIVWKVKLRESFWYCTYDWISHFFAEYLFIWENEVMQFQI